MPSTKPNRKSGSRSTCCQEEKHIIMEEEAVVLSVFEKYRLIKFFQQIVVSFIFFQNLLVILVVFFLISYTWLEFCAKEVTNSWMFRLRTIEIDQEAESFEEEDTSNSQWSRMLPQLWRRKQHKSFVLSDMDTQRPSRLVVIQNPPTVVDGFILPSVSFATEGTEAFYPSLRWSQVTAKHLFSQPPAFRKAILLSPPTVKMLISPTTLGLEGHRRTSYPLLLSLLLLLDRWVPCVGGIYGYNPILGRTVCKRPKFHMVTFFLRKEISFGQLLGSLNEQLSDRREKFKQTSYGGNAGWRKGNVISTSFPLRSSGKFVDVDKRFKLREQTKGITTEERPSKETQGFSSRYRRSQTQRNITETNDTKKKMAVNLLTPSSLMARQTPTYPSSIIDRRNVHNPREPLRPLTSNTPVLSLTEGEPDDQACALLLNLKNLPVVNIQFRVDEDLHKTLTFRESAPSNPVLGRKRSLSNSHESPEPLSKSQKVIGATNRGARSISNPLPKKPAPKPVLPTPPVLKNNPDIAQSHQARWMERFLELQTYKEKHGTCNVTFAKEHESYKTLAYWVSNQRISYRKKNMPADRVDLLKSLGFDFSQVGRDGTTDISEESGSDGDKKKKKKVTAEPFPRLPSPFNNHGALSQRVQFTKTFIDTSITRGNEMKGNGTVSLGLIFVLYVSVYLCEGRSVREDDGTNGWKPATEKLNQVKSMLQEVFHNTSLPLLDCPPIDFTQYSHLHRASFNVLFATNTHQTQELLPSQILAIAEVIDFLGPDRIGLSILESGSKDLTRDIINGVVPQMTRLFGVSDEDVHISTNAEKIDWPSDNRVAIMARLRNELLEPLLFSKRGARYDLVFIYNDVGLCGRDLLEMLHHHVEQKAHISCSLDWKIGGNGEFMYDEWVFRDINGYLLQPQGLDSMKMDGSHDWFRQSPFSWIRWKAKLPFQVFTCWNGMAVMDARPLKTKQVVFRRSEMGECAESECYLVCKDYWRTGYDRIQVVPTVNVGYNLNESALFRKKNEEKAIGREQLKKDIVWRKPPKKAFCLWQPEKNGRDVSPWYQAHTQHPLIHINRRWFKRGPFDDSIDHPITSTIKRAKKTPSVKPSVESLMASGLVKPAIAVLKPNVENENGEQPTTKPKKAVTKKTVAKKKETKVEIAKEEPKMMDESHTEDRDRRAIGMTIEEPLFVQGGMEKQLIKEDLLKEERMSYGDWRLRWRDDIRTHGDKKRDVSPRKDVKHMDKYRGDFPFTPLVHSANYHIFNNTSFREYQLEAIHSIMEGRDTFIGLPTGGGKSLIYQLPAVCSNGLTIIVSPLLSLMEDQVKKVEACGVPVGQMSSSVTSSDRRKTINDIEADILHSFSTKNPHVKMKMLYVTPERIGQNDQDLYAAKMISRFVVDEAHCISEWGHDFRPNYRKLSVLARSFPEVPIVCCTASATEVVREDIINTMEMKSATVIVSSYNRPNLCYYVRSKGKDPAVQVIQFIKEKHPDSCGLVYCMTTTDCERLSHKMKEKGFSVSFYHAGMTHQMRAEVQAEWMSGRIKILCTTTAFGMGIDKANLRFVVHHAMASSLEAYYQQSGRAGRDGLPSDCLMLHKSTDRGRIVGIMSKGMYQKKARSMMFDKLDDIGAYVENTTKCRRQMLHFGEEAPAHCGNCDICLGTFQKDATVPAPAKKARTRTKAAEDKKGS
ncbi:hypothetical protein PROFUN_14712 [Planoprotostelium fungivorum]|uniref:DNA 3'-5' helicase n=1 Tax=Planoprotostelium fungivorum TaxID=1890364 RepID=A0A2P6MZ38_9EUKA|nr:hypothetical protein PROFUN_14712 [Planoprotostelium fungivorum]